MPWGVRFHSKAPNFHKGTIDYNIIIILFLEIIPEKGRQQDGQLVRKNGN